MALVIGYGRRTKGRGIQAVSRGRREKHHQGEGEVSRGRSKTTENTPISGGAGGSSTACISSKLTVTYCLYTKMPPPPSASHLV